MPLIFYEKKMIYVIKFVINLKQFLILNDSFVGKKFYLRSKDSVEEYKDKNLHPSPTDHDRHLTREPPEVINRFWSHILPISRRPVE